MLRNGIEARGRDEASAQEPGRCLWDWEGTKPPRATRRKQGRRTCQPGTGAWDAEPDRHGASSGPGHRRDETWSHSQMREGGPGPAPHVAWQKRRKWWFVRPSGPVRSGPPRAWRQVGVARGAPPPISSAWVPGPCCPAPNALLGTWDGGARWTTVIRTSHKVHRLSELSPALEPNTRFFFP